MNSLTTLEVSALATRPEPAIRALAMHILDWENAIIEVIHELDQNQVADARIRLGKMIWAFRQESITHQVWDSLEGLA